MLDSIWTIKRIEIAVNHIVMSGSKSKCEIKKQILLRMIYFSFFISLLIGFQRFKIDFEKITKIKTTELHKSTRCFNLIIINKQRQKYFVSPHTFFIKTSHYRGITDKTTLGCVAYFRRHVIDVRKARSSLAPHSDSISTFAGNSISY